MPIKKTSKKSKEQSADIEIIVGTEVVTANLLSYAGGTASHQNISTVAPIVRRNGESHFRAAQRAGNVAIAMLCNEQRIGNPQII